MLSDKDIASLYENIDRLDNDSPKNGLANKSLVLCGGKSLANNKQKPPSERDEGSEWEAVMESTLKAENLKYSSMCSNNPFMENPEYRRNGEERNHSMRVLCDNNRNRKDSFPAARKWNASASQDVDINENFTEPAIHHRINLSYHVEQNAAAAAVMANNNGAGGGGRYSGGSAIRFGASPYKAADEQGLEKQKRQQSISRGLSAEQMFSVDTSTPPPSTLSVGLNRDQYTCLSNSNTRTSTANGRILDANVTSMGFSVFKFGIEPPGNPASNDQRPILRGAPIVPHRRSQSTPRPAHNIASSSVGSSCSSSNNNNTSHSLALMNGSGSEPKKKSEMRPKSLDRGVTYLENVTVQMHSTVYNQFSGHTSPRQVVSKNLGTMKNSASFHGQCYLSTTEGGVNLNELSGSGDKRGRINEGTRKPNRPHSYTYGSISEQAFLENQLRMYSEQLKSITESVRKYSEKAKLLSELKRQEILSNGNKKSNGYSMSTSKSDSKLSSISTLTDASTNPPLNEEHKQTSSHQLRLFLEDIRSNIRDSDSTLKVTEPVPNCDTRLGASKGKESVVVEVGQRRITEQPPPIPQRKRQTLKDNTNTASPALAGSVESDSKPDLCLTGNHHLSSAPNMHRSSSNEMDFNQILDNFNFASKQFMTTTSNRADYLEDYLTAMRRTSNEIRQAALTMKQNNLVQDPASSSSDENSSTSTTPGSIRQAVQNLLAMPRNGVQVMDDRMRLFIDILDTQDKFSQVYIDGVLYLIYLTSLFLASQKHSHINH